MNYHPHNENYEVMYDGKDWQEDRKNKYKKIKENKRGREIKKRIRRYRDLSNDPKLPKKNFNKVGGMKVGFSWCKRNAYHTSVFHNTYQKNELKCQYAEYIIDKH